MTSGRRRLKMMWDYAAFPLWSHGQGQQVSMSGLPISDELRTDLQRWSDEWTTAMWGEEGPDSPRWRPPSDDARARWDADGRRLAERLRGELSDFEVGYFDEATGEIEWPGSA